MNNQNDEAYAKLVNTSLRYVSIRPRSIAEIHEYLLKKIKKIKDISSDSIIIQVLDRLKELGYADDLKFAKWWVNARFSSNPKGIYAIRYELMKKNVNREIINQAINEINIKPNEEYDSSQEIESARKYISKVLKNKINSHSTLSKIKLKHLLFSRLANRGFDSKIITTVIDGILGKDYNIPQVE